MELIPVEERYFVCADFDGNNTFPRRCSLADWGGVCPGQPAYGTNSAAVLGLMGMV